MLILRQGAQSLCSHSRRTRPLFKDDKQKPADVPGDCTLASLRPSPPVKIRLTNDQLDGLLLSAVAYSNGGVREATMSRFQLLISAMHNVRLAISCGLKCFFTWS